MMGFFSERSRAQPPQARRQDLPDGLVRHGPGPVQQDDRQGRVQRARGARALARGRVADHLRIVAAVVWSAGVEAFSAHSRVSGNPVLSFLGSGSPLSRGRAG